MASISREPNGRRTIQFVAPDKRRRSIRLGKVSQRAAEAIRGHVEQLVSAAISGHTPANETTRWVAALDDSLAVKLAKVGLIPERSSATLAAFLGDHTATRIDVKSSTQTVWGHTKRNLVEHFGANKPLREINRGDAEHWRLYLVAQELAEPTIRKRCQFAKQFFSAAVKLELIPDNPFRDLKSASLANPTRYYFISRAEAEKVIDACPDGQWRLLFALSRFGGLRCPSEHLALRWPDVDWEHDRMTVQSPKTEHHPGGESRIIPIFPELRPHLEAAWEMAEPGTVHVITRYRDANANLRTQLLRIIRRAGLKPWPKLFANLRSTRETELAESFPIHVVCEWIGNSQRVAARHYLQTTDEHFEKAVQNPVQQTAELARKAQKPDTAAHKKTPCFAGVCDTLRHGAQVSSGGEGTRTLDLGIANEGVSCHETTENTCLPRVTLSVISASSACNGLFCL
jgi:integrase